MEGYAQVQSWSLVDMLMCSGGQWGDMLRCRAGHWWIGLCEEVVNGGYAQVQELSIVYMLRCSGGQWWICSHVGVINSQYAHVQ